MDLRPQAPGIPPVVLGPESIARVADALDRVGPALVGTSYRMLRDGGLEIADAAGAEAIGALRRAVDEALPAEVRAHVGEHSGLGWDVFFAHVVAWWLPQRNRLGFLRALVDRAALHGIRLSLHWNSGREVEPTRLPAGSGPVVWGGLIGLAMAIVLRQWRHEDSVLGLLAIAAGIAVGRQWQRHATRHRCGDPLCRAPLSRREHTCPSCGATVP
jgi:hypothetical protein